MLVPFRAEVFGEATKAAGGLCSANKCAEPAVQMYRSRGGWRACCPEHSATCQHYSAKTALSRLHLSKPARILKERGLLHGRILDYGCGRGRDVEELTGRVMCVEGWDPYWRPTMPQGTFDVVLCTYVLNVLPSEEEADVLEGVRSFLEPEEGTAYLTVRRDVGPDGFRRSGYYQRNVKLDLPVAYEWKGALCIYRMDAQLS